MEKETLQNYLEKRIDKNIIIKQEGFIKAKYGIKKMKYLIEDDILTITGETNKNYLQINTNQINNIETKEDKIILHLDNDLNIIINM